MRQFWVIYFFNIIGQQLALFYGNGYKIELNTFYSSISYFKIYVIL